jgi:hypothetical protein
MPHINDPLLQAYIDGFCGAARVAEIEGHLAECAECSARLERARGAAARASKLLGSLEPGPIHEPSFEDLKERAVARSTESTIDPAAALELARAATADVGKPRAPLWRRPALAWAATVVIAFAVGWMTRSGIDLLSPTGFASQPQSPGGRFDELGGNDAASGSGSRVAGEQAGEAAPAVPEQFRQSVPVDERDQAAEAAKATVADNVAPPPEPVASAPARASAEGQERPGTASEELARREREASTQAAGAERRAASSQQEPVAVTGRSPAVDVDTNERTAALGGILADTDAEVAEGFVVIDRADLEPWLGAPPRELPEAALLRVEVGPGALLDNGVAGRNAARLIYWARGGEEIVLTQQYLGSPPQPRPVADLPALVSEPGGPATYTWLDDDGYLLSVSAMMEPDIVRQIAGLVR